MTTDLSDLRTFGVVICDLNGQMRGKRVPGSYAGKLGKGAVRMPLSALNVDIWGTDIADSPLVFETGDADGVLTPTGRGPLPAPWYETPTALVPMQMQTDTGEAFGGDPRHALTGSLDRYAARGWTVIAATELEFTIVDTTQGELAPPDDPLTGRAIDGGEVLSMAQLEAFDGFFADVYRTCAAMDLPAQTATSESGIGQFEITLNHQDALRAADDTWLFKAVVRGIARKHGLRATFMAKPYPDDAGNGLHMHFSVLDRDGHNIFDDGGPDGTPLLRQAVAGCLETMPAATLIFAPHANSYDRFVDGAHAPTAAAWGYENRTAALRIPGGPSSARRIEHRVAGGDINPYLLFAVVLGAALDGIERGAEPPAPVSGNAYEQDLPGLAPDWQTAIDRFETDAAMARILPGQLIRNLVLMKRQEIRGMAAIAAEEVWKVYLDRV